jgi:hypothetical protein
MDIERIEYALKAANITDTVKRITLKRWFGALSLPTAGTLQATQHDRLKQELYQQGIHPATAACFLAALQSGPGTTAPLPAIPRDPLRQSVDWQSPEAVRLGAPLHRS